MENDKKKRGRPPKDSSRRNRVKVSLTDSELAELRKYSELSGESLNSIIRDGLKKEFNLRRMRY